MKEEKKQKPRFEGFLGRNQQTAVFRARGRQEVAVQCPAAQHALGGVYTVAGVLAASGVGD